MTSTIYIICICILSILCCYLIKKLYEFSVIIISIEDSLEESLDLLNEKYASMNKILNTPIFFDSVEVRQVVNDISDCHRAILVVANKLTKDVGMINDVKEENSTQKAQ